MVKETNGQKLEFTEAPPRQTPMQYFVRVFFSRRIVIFSCIILTLMVISAVFAPWLAPYQPNKPEPRNALAQPSWEHLLGTDSLGRDILSRIIFGSRTSLLVGFVCVLLGGVTGVALGLTSGYFGGWVSHIIMRYVDAQMAFPGLILVLLIAGLLGGGLYNVVIALSIGVIPGYARLMRGQTLSVRENDYVMASMAIGASSSRIIWRHVFPNAFPPIIVAVTGQLGRVILQEAGLSFLGVGIAPPTPTWGAMVSEGYQYLLNNPLLSFAPGIAIVLVVYAFNMMGDGLRDALDPRLRGTL